MRPRSLLLLAPLVVAACSSTAGSSDSNQAAVDAAPDISRTLIAESGRLAPDASMSADVTLAGRVAAYRFNAFGKSKVMIAVSSSDFTPSFTVDGPIPGQERHVVAFKEGTASGGASSLELTLDAPGAYRILVGSRAMLEGGAATGAAHVDLTCEANCDLPEVSLAAVLRDMKGKYGQDALGSAIGQWLQSNVADPDLQKAIGDQIAQATSADIPDDLTVPVLPMSLLRVAQGLFEEDRKAPAPAPATQTLDLQQILADCTVTRATRSPVNAALPGLEEGDFADYSYDDCSLARAEAFATVLNNLAIDNGSAVTNGDARYETIDDVVRGLVASGHRIRVDNSRYFADFLGLAYNGATVRAPMFLDTGIALPAGGTLTMPAPHAQHNIYVSGPLLNAHLKFYMGVDAGTAFRAQATIMRHWSGGHAVYSYDTSQDADAVVKLLSLAGTLRKKWMTEGADKPALGYGTIGVCTDSTAILEYAMEGTITLWPLAHPKTDASADDIDEILSKLPADVEGFDPDDALARIRSTIPFPTLDDVPFAPFVAAMKTL